MAEYIRREDAIKCIEGQCVDGKMWGSDESEGTLIEAYSAIDDLMEIPAADVAPVRHARWKPFNRNLEQCSDCEGVAIARSRFCPNCGSKMDG